MKGWVKVQIDFTEEEYLKIKQKKGRKTWKEILYEWYQLTEKEEVKR